MPQFLKLAPHGLDIESGPLDAQHGDIKYQGYKPLIILDFDLIQIASLNSDPLAIVLQISCKFLVVHLREEFLQLEVREREGQLHWFLGLVLLIHRVSGYSMHEELQTCTLGFISDVNVDEIS